MGREGRGGRRGRRRGGGRKGGGGGAGGQGEAGWLPPHLQPQVESPGDLGRLDLGQERAHSCLLIAVAVLLSSTSFLNGLFYGDPGKVFRPYLIFSGYKGWRRGQRDLGYGTWGRGPQRKPPVCTTALRSPRHFCLEGWLFDVLSGDCCPAKLHPRSKDSSSRGIRLRTWEHVSSRPQHS